MLQLKKGQSSLRKKLIKAFMMTLTSALILAYVSVSSSAPGVESSIKYLFVVEMSHLDIGFTDPPDVVEEFYKTNIDHVIANCKADPDYKWTIEEIWQLEQWLKRSTPSEIDELIGFVKAGRISLTAGYASMHSGVLVHEEINRFLYPAKEISEAWNISIETIIQDDVPGYSWALPQVLNKSNIKYMVTGINTWGDMGKPSIPMSDDPFYWQGPDGSKVLTWISFDAYVEGFFTYGLTDLANAYSKLSTKLPQLEAEGYPYDAVLVMRGGDNLDTSLNMANLARQWNSTYDNPKIVLAHPEDFFRYMENKYSGQFPTYSGDWTSWWDILGMTQPQSITKNRWAHDNIISAEKLSTINHLLGLQAYPVDDIELAYKKMMEFDEHMTGGAPWPDYMTPEETQIQNQILCGYATTAYNTTEDILQTALNTFVSNIRSDNASIIVFNPLSWNRTDVVKANLSDGLFSQTFDLLDSETGLSVTYQKLEASREIMFVAENVPSIGYKRFEINLSQPSTPSSSVYVFGNIIGNQFYEITLDTDGHITSIYDKEADRELVNQLSEFEFNKAIKASNAQVWSGEYSVVPTGTSQITIGMNGSVAKSLIVNRQSSPHIKTEVILYNDIKRIDFVNIMNRTLMAYVPYSTGFVWYAYPFPFNLTSFDVELEIANTFMTPEADNLPGANTAYFPTQHGLEMFESDYGVTWASKETFCHEFEGINLYATTFSPSEATLVSRWIKKEDEGQFKGGSIGPIEQEPGASPILTQTYSFTTHPGPFNPVNTSHFIWSYSNPLLAKEVSSNPNGALFYPSMSFFSVNSSSVMLLNVKKADFGDDYIFRLLEIEGSQTTVRLGSSYFHIDQAILTNNVEENLKKLSTEEGYAVVSIGPFETLTIRVKLAMQLARFSVATLYEVHLEVNLHLLNGTSLKVFFYNYKSVYEANVTVWSGLTPTHVMLSANILHPLNKGIENATLVLTDNGENIISTLASFMMRRSDLFQRLLTMDLDWPYVSPEQRSTMMEEYADIDVQWSYAGA